MYWYKKGNLKETLEPSDGSFLTNESLVYHVHSSDKLKNGNGKPQSKSKQLLHQVFQNISPYFFFGPQGG